MDTLGCYGNRFVHTPRLDALAASGLRFENAFCNSPVCTPSRASLLTGRYPRTNRCRKNGHSLPPNETLVTRLLADAGYDCGLAGKLHLSACHPSIAPETEPRLNDGYREFHWSHHPAADWPGNGYSQWLARQGTSYRTTPLPETRHVVRGLEGPFQQTTWCAERAIDFIDRHAGADQPWLFSVNLFAPHHPFDPPAAHLARYRDRLAEIPLPAFTPGELDRKTTHQRRDHAAAYGVPELYPYPEMSDTEHRLIRAAYWAMIDLIDEQVGRILDALDRTGQRDNTLVIFMSDHGELLGDHGIYLKGPHFYDASVRVPLLLSLPGVVPPGVARGLVELIDLAPTLLRFAGIPDSPAIQGWPLQPLFGDPARSHRPSVFCENNDFDDPGFAMMVRTERLKLMSYHNGEGELYDLAADPGEVHNLWSDASRHLQKMEMLNLLVERLAQTADPLPARRVPW